MKRRNAEICRMRRPVKRTKITEGMYGSSMLYLKFVMLWASVVMVDYMLEFRFEFLWPFWMMLKSVYDSYKYQGLAFSFLFVCITITSDMICFCFIPLQYIFFAASTYVWVQYVWYMLSCRGWFGAAVLAAGAALLEARWAGAGVGVGVWGAGPVGGAGGVAGGGAPLWRAAPAQWARPLAAHTVGYVVLSMAVGAKAYLGHRIRLHWQRQVLDNELYYQFFKETLADTGLDQKECPCRETTDIESEPRLRKRPVDAPTPKVDKIDRHVPSQNSHRTHNGVAHGANDLEEKHEHNKASAKPPKCDKKEASTLKEEKRKNRNKDKDSDSHKSTEQTKEQNIVKETDLSTKDISVRNHKENCSTRDKEKERDREMKERERDMEKRERELREKERERDREMREREKEIREKEKERERERERELKEAREIVEELRRVKADLASSRLAENEAKRALAAALERQRQLADTQQRIPGRVAGSRACLDRRLGEERRARPRADLRLAKLTHQADHKPNSSECENEWCKSARAESNSLKREIQRQSEQIRSLEAQSSSCSNHLPHISMLVGRAAHLEKALSAETRVKLDLLSALGAANRHITKQEGLISRQEKEIEELKAQMLAVMPTEYIQNPNNTRRAPYSALDPNASAYTPKQLLTDA